MPNGNYIPIPGQDRTNRIPAVNGRVTTNPSELLTRAKEAASGMLRPMYEGSSPRMPSSGGMPIPGPKPEQQISMDQLKSTPDYVTKFLIDLARSVLGLTDQSSSRFQIPSPTPSHGYTVAEGGKPETVTAEGAYFPFERGNVIPMEGRQFGGEVSPSRHPNLYMDGIDTRTGIPMESRRDGGEVEPATTGYRMPYREPPGESFAESFAEKEKRFREWTTAEEAEWAKRVGRPTAPTSTPLVEMALNPAGTYEAKPTRYGETIPSGGKAAPYPGPWPWRNIPARAEETAMSGEIPTSPSFTRAILPSGETRYTLPGTEGTMTLPSGWNAAEEGRKYMAGMKEGVVYGGYPSRPMELPTGPESRTDINPEQAIYNAYLADKELREAAGLSPRRGMAEYEYSAAGMRMTPRERLARIKSEGELAKQYYASKGLFDVARLEHGPGSPASQAKLAEAYYHREMPGVQREWHAEYAQARVDAAKENALQRIQTAKDKAGADKEKRQLDLYNRILNRYKKKDIISGTESFDLEAASPEIKRMIKGGLLNEDFGIDLQEAPPVPGAKLAPDGKWYVPDPRRKGKYLRVD